MFVNMFELLFLIKILNYWRKDAVTSRENMMN